VDYQGDAQQSGHQTTWARGKTTHPQHQVWTPPAQYPCRLKQRHCQFPRGRQELQASLAPQTLNPNPFNGKPTLWDQPGLYLRPGTNPENLLALVTQQLGYRQGRKDMSAGPAGHDG
jgi:hypothetical protein